MKRTILLITLLFVLAFGGALHAATLRVVVKDQNTNDKISGATVCYGMLDGSKNATLTTGSGGGANFDLVPTGSLQLVAFKAGFVGTQLTIKMPAVDFQQDVRLLPGSGGITTCPQFVPPPPPPPPPPTPHDLKVDVTQTTPDPVLTGSTATYTIIVKNLQNTIEGDVVLNVSFPTNSIIAQGCRISGASAVCEISRLNGGAQQQFFMTPTMPTTAGLIKVIADVALSKGLQDSDESNNRDTVVTRVVAAPDLDVDIDSQNGSPSNQLKWDVIAKNQGDGAASRYAVKITIPKEATFDRAESNTIGSCIRGSDEGQNQVVNCTGDSLAAAATRHALIIANLKSNIQGGTQVLFNSAIDPENDITEQNERNNLASAADTVHPLCDLIVSSGRIRLGFVANVGFPAKQQMLLDVTVKNNGPEFCDVDAAVVKVQWPDNVIENVCPGNTVFDPSTNTCFAVENPPCFDSCDASGLSHLSAGNSAVITTSQAFRSVFDHNPSTITGTIDINGQVPETNEQNNTNTFGVQ